MNDAKRIINKEQKLASQLRSIGRGANYAIIAAAWAVSIAKGQFVPIPHVFLSLLFSTLYIMIDFLYYILPMFIYSIILKRYFKPVSDGVYEYKNEDQKEAVSKVIKSLAGFRKGAFNMLMMLLLGSAACLVLSLSSLLVHS